MLKFSKILFLFVIFVASSSYLVLDNGSQFKKSVLLLLGAVENFWQLNRGNEQKLAAELTLERPSEEVELFLGRQETVENKATKKEAAFLKSLTKQKSSEPNDSKFLANQHISQTTTSLTYDLANLKNLDHLCFFKTNKTTARQVILNEIAWAGSPRAEFKSKNSALADEWIELKNISSSTIDLTGWQILSSDGKIKITLNGAIESGNFYLLERTDDDSVLDVKADQIYTGVLDNNGAHIRLFNQNCELVDEIEAFPWPGGDAATNRTLERMQCFTTSDCGWQTSLAEEGTPKRENSFLNQATTQKFYTLTVLKAGDGEGMITSDIDGISCGTKCEAQYPAQTKIIIKAIPSVGASWGGWSDKENCGSGNICTIYLKKDLTLTANFIASSRLSASSTIDNKKEVDRLVIVEIQITGGPGKTNDDFIKIYNPSDKPFNLKGYRLVKRTKTGSKDYLIKSWTTDTFIPPLSYYIWANSNFNSPSFAPDTTTASYIAEDNGIAIRRGANDVGEIIDAVGWGAAQNIFVEGSSFPVNPSANQILRRKFIAGQFKDTNNNAEDFEL